MNKIALQSERIKLRLIKLSDLDAVHTLHSFSEVDQYNTLGIPKTLEETENLVLNWIKANEALEIMNHTFIIEENKTNQFIGLIALRLGHVKFKTGEVWYKLLPEFWRKGLATEALQTVLAFGFTTLQLHRIEAGCAVENIGSVKVLEKAGMTLEGRKRKVLPLKTGWSDNFMYAILEEECFSGRGINFSQPNSLS